MLGHGVQQPWWCSGKSFLLLEFTHVAMPEAAILCDKRVERHRDGLSRDGKAWDRDAVAAASRHRDQNQEDSITGSYSTEMRPEITNSRARPWFPGRSQGKMFIQVAIDVTDGALTDMGRQPGSETMASRDHTRAKWWNRVKNTRKPRHGFPPVCCPTRRRPIRTYEHYCLSSYWVSRSSGSHGDR